MHQTFQNYKRRTLHETSLQVATENVGKGMTKPQENHIVLLQIDTYIITEKNWNAKEGKSMIHVLYALQLAHFGMKQRRTVKPVDLSSWLNASVS